jgi:ribose transport system permease protein
MGVPSDFAATLRRAVALIGPLPIALLFVVIVVGAAEPRFATGENIENVARQMAVLGIIAAGQALPILSGGFDISVGAVIALTSLVTGLALVKYGVLAGVIAGVLFGGLIGTMNGVIIAVFRVSPFVVTLGMASFARGGALTLTGGEVVFGLPEQFKGLAETNVWILPLPFVIAIFSFVACWLLLERTIYGRYIYAIGGNEEAARLAGVKTRVCKALAYTANGLLVGLASVVLTARVGSGEPNLGLGSELDAIAAVVIGGVALGGGQGSIWGVGLGVVTLSLLSNSLNLLGMSTYTQLMVIGGVIIAATIVDRLRHRSA